MKIIYLHQYFNTPDMYGGTRSYEIGRRLVSWGHEVHIVTSDRSGSKNGLLPDWYETEEAGMQVHWLPVPYANRMRFKDRVKAFIKFAVMSSKKAASLKGDVIFATSTPLTIAIPGIYASKSNGTPMVFEVRDLWPELPIAIGALRNRGLIAAASTLEKQAYKNSAQVIALSPGMKEGVVRTGYPANQVHIIPNSSDIQLFDVPKEKGLEFRHSYDWLGDRPLIVYAGTFGKINGVGYLPKVAAETLKINPDIRFMLIGRGAEEQEVRSLASSLGVLNKNLFMPGTLPKNEMPAVFSAADISTSLFIDLKEMWANSANKYFDSLASGTPVAINYQGWQAEILQKHEAGLVLPPHNYTKAACKLVKHLSDQEWLKRAGQNALELAKEKYNRDKLAKNLEQVLLTAIKNNSNKPLKVEKSL